MMMRTIYPIGGRWTGIALATMLAACGGGGTNAVGLGAIAPAPPSSAPPTPTPSVASVADVFVNPVADATASDKAAAYIGWAATAGATAYLVRYAIGGGAVATLSVMSGTGVLLSGLPQGAGLSVTVAAVTGAGTGVDSAPVTATLPRAVTAVEAAAYAAAASYSDAQSGEAVVVARNGQTVYTHYSAGYANAAHPLASGTKSFSCAFAGFAAQDGYLSLADKASATIGEWAGDPKKGTISLNDLLSLQSGLTGNPAYSAGLATQLDTYQLTVADTATYAPGQAFVYDPLAFQAFALAFQLRTGGVYGGNGQVTGGTDPISYLQARLFAPLGVATGAYGWTRDAKGHPQMAGGASFTATDWLKYGQFALQRGTWQSTRLLPATWIDQCTGGYKNPAYLGYGISWWLNAHNNGTYDATIDRVPADGAPQPGSDQFAPSAPADTYMAAGTGKERLYVIPSQGLVIVRLAPLNSGVGSDWSDNLFLAKLLGAVP